MLHYMRTAGGLLASVPAAEAAACVAALRDRGFSEAAVVGQVNEGRGAGELSCGITVVL